jgi:hypothetical protein
MRNLYYIEVVHKRGWGEWVMGIQNWGRGLQESRGREVGKNEESDSEHTSNNVALYFALFSPLVEETVVEGAGEEEQHSDRSAL